MISSASTLFLAVLVMTNSVFAAPLRLPPAQSAVTPRADTAPELVARAPSVVVDVPPLHKRSTLGTFSRRSARLPKQDDLPPSEVVESPVPRDVNEPTIVRRYPRRVYYDHYNKREDVTPPVVQKREELPRVYPRRVYYEKYEKREPSPDPATKVTKITATVVSETFDTPKDTANGAQVPPPAHSVSSTVISFSQTQTLPPPAVPTATSSSAVAAATATSTPTDSTTAIPPPNVNQVTGGKMSFVPAPGAQSGTSTVAGSATTSSVVAAATSTSTASGSTATSASGTVVSPPPLDADPVSGGTQSLAPVATDAAGTSVTAPTSTDSTVANIDQATGGTSSFAPAPSDSPTGSTTTPPPDGASTVTDSTSASLDQPTGGTPSFAPRPSEATDGTVVRRSAYSGAAWASFVRRQSK